MKANEDLESLKIEMVESYARNDHLSSELGKYKS